jgi:tryptophan 7-halogenase
MRSVAVIGGGITAWSAAAALKKRIPLLDVTLVPAKIPAGALADRMISTLPSIHGFHHDIGLTDEDTVTRAGSGVRLGTLLHGWGQALPDYVHAYGPCGAPVGGISFHQLWLRERRAAELPPFDRFSRAAEMARSGDVRLIEGVEAGLQLTLDRYAEMMRAYALHVGVIERRTTLRDVQLRAEDGFVESLVLQDGASLTADLFVDCSGPAALLRSRLAGDFVVWSEWLPCDRLIFAKGDAVPDAVTLDRATTSSAGWRWLTSSPTQSSRGLAYSSAHALEIERESESLEPYEEVTLRQGRWRDLWVGNCVAIGDAAVAVEPLEWTNLHLAHSQIDRLVAMMPGTDCAKVELAEFNRQCAAEADRVRDFLCLHYLLARRPEPFWKEAAAVAPPPSLAHTLSQFAERGRLPYYEEETFARDSWLTVLLSQGFEPRRTDPLAELVSPAQARQAIQAMRQSLERSAPFIPASAPVDLNPRGAR